jgi:serine/threonine protein kinase
MIANRIKDIFVSAAELDSPEARRAYLDEACNGDAGVRHRVEALLAAHDSPVSVLDEAAIGPPIQDATADVASREAIHERPGSVIDHYKLLQELGEGGFGIVYMAEQQAPVRRQVALKIIKPGMDTREVVARFEAERQALALMDHPNIAKVFDAGTVGVHASACGAPDAAAGDTLKRELQLGRPYFVMELVKGVPITEFCDKNNSSTRERLGLFITVCRAVQHAHQKGIIHRDLKPSNVMITLHDGKPVPKVIDFGVSKAINQRLTERTLFTHYGQMVGTPQYMSPEQAEMSGLDVDTRSDIYSLGVLLYELLTGTTPLDRQRLHSAGYAEMLRIIQN